MARYIDVETALKIIDNYAKTVTADGIVVVKAIRDIVEIITPTADVVPKSEVEKLVQDSTRLVQEKDALIKNYAECMKDYARDIFEGIEKHLIFNTYGIATISNKTFAELKKKYIGGNDDRL